MDSSGKEQEEGIVSPREWFNRNAKSYDDALSSTPQQVALNLPKLKKTGNEAPKLNLPKLKKVNV